MLHKGPAAVVPLALACSLRALRQAMQHPALWHLALSLALRILSRLERHGEHSMGMGMVMVVGMGFGKGHCALNAFQRCCSPVPGHHRNFTCIPTAWIFPWRRGRGWAEFQQETAGESLTHTLPLFSVFFCCMSLLPGSMHRKILPLLLWDQGTHLYVTKKIFKSYLLFNTIWNKLFSYQISLQLPVFKKSKKIYL